MDRAKHPALLMVDTISSLASMDFRQDEWGVDVAIAGSQKGLMLPPGLGFNAVSEKALAASKSARMPQSYWDWQAMLGQNKSGFFPYTPATNLLYGLRESLQMLHEEGLENVFERQPGMAKRRAAPCAPGDSRRCARSRALQQFRDGCFCAASGQCGRVSQSGPRKLQHVARQRARQAGGQGFPHRALGDFNDLMLAGTLSGVEMG